MLNFNSYYRYMLNKINLFIKEKKKKFINWDFYTRQNKLYVKFRLKKYKLKKYINSSMDILEIGSNKGTIANILSKNCKSYTCIEPLNKSKYYSKNINFINENFNDDVISKLNTYDLIICPAVLGYVVYNAEELLGIFGKLLNNNGILFLENTSWKNIEEEIINLVKKSKNFKLINAGKLKDIDQTRKFYYIKKIE